MWPFTKKVSLRGIGVFSGFQDAHSHILPGVDDGVQTMEEALAILSLYEELGITTVTLTPHVMEDIPNTTEELKARFEDLKAAYKGPIQLRLAAEYMLDSLFLERLEKEDFLFWADNTLLVETSYFNPPAKMDAIISRLHKKGYTVILAHPERYEYMGPERYAELKSYGLKFQLNLLSLTGSYGAGARAKAIKLLEDGMYNYSGTDIHSIRSFAHHIESKVLDKKKLEKFFAVWK